MEIQFAYWVPNVSGGLVTSNIAQRTDWSFEYNHRLALTAEAAGFDFALAQALPSLRGRRLEEVAV
jgi:FMNH2-dependent dimethyl sulfone monooxygenase